MTARVLLLALALSASTGVLRATDATHDLSALAWLAGSWEGRDERGLQMEETWLSPRGGTMLGLHRDVAGDRTVSFEFLRIAKDADGLVYWASPGGRPATAFRMVEAGPKRAVFANPSHDFPKRILYWIDETGALRGRAEGEEGARALEWTWRRADR